MGDANQNGDGKITLYTNYRCPWAHRAQIALKEMSLDYDEVIIDLDNPRPDWYLKINPRGLVPAIVFEHPALGKKQIIESGLVVHFLLDSYPHLSQKIWPTPINVETAHLRYRMNYFVDTYFSKVQPHWFKVMMASGTEQEESKRNDMVAAFREHIEPLLEDAKPFFGGSSTMTLAEILTAPFILRAYSLSDGKYLSTKLREELDDLPNFSLWAHAINGRESVVCTWDEELQRKTALERLPKMREKYGAAAK